MPAGSSSRPSVSLPRRTVAEPAAPRREPGWPQVALVAVAVVEIQRAIFYGPVLIGVLIVGTAWLLWRIAHGRPLDDER